ncbi:hypothetical protein B0H13DRAFT_2300937 [Mycena leptocephala]|nr:hypothetical protein B0H13DRAFT_2300937 [Mycena leptocephala]
MRMMRIGGEAAVNTVKTFAQPLLQAAAHYITRGPVERWRRCDALGLTTGPIGPVAHSMAAPFQTHLHHDALAGVRISCSRAHKRWPIEGRELRCRMIRTVLEARNVSLPAGLARTDADALWPHALVRTVSGPGDALNEGVGQVAHGREDKLHEGVGGHYSPAPALALELALLDAHWTFLVVRRMQFERGEKYSQRVFAEISPSLAELVEQGKLEAPWGGLLALMLGVTVLLEIVARERRLFLAIWWTRPVMLRSTEGERLIHWITDDFGIEPEYGVFPR